ncbi:MAG: DNA polymerase III subunit alpha [Rhodospirillales bacterium]|nr:DNA polymerase III subunit alpha [Rhodospirillales bacterium]
MTCADFVHLRVHSAYSLSEGAIRIKQLAQLCRQLRMPAVALTDTNNLFGGMEFSVTLAQAGVQPIIGCQFQPSGPRAADVGFAPRARREQAPGGFVVLAQNAAGYGNILALLACAHGLGAVVDEATCGGEAPGRAPGLSTATLCQHSEGLILLTGGAAGPLGRLIQAGQEDEAERMLASLRDAFPGRLYVEIQRHGLEAEALTEPHFLALAARHDLPIVASNEACFATPDMFEAHDALLCIAEGVHIADAERRRLTPEHYFKSAEEMKAAFADLPDAIANTLLIAQRCAFMIEPRKPILPPFVSAGGGSEEDALRAEAAAGLDRRLHALRGGDRAGEGHNAAGWHRDEDYHERLGYELDVICEMGFAGYFLIVSEFIRWAKVHAIPVGPGRGSGAGSVVAWALTITDLDPLRFGLLFERFLNPERVSMPDFDIDFCQDRRDEVIAHVQESYGRDRVAQIITFGKLQARAVLRDTGRVLGMPYGYVDKICKLVPNNPANPVTLAQALDAEPQLRELIAGDEAVAKLVDIATRLEGLYRHASTHAAGVVIADRPLQDLIPLYSDPRSDIPVTGFNMKWVEAAGLVKFDFLGLKTLTVLARAALLIAESHGRSIDLTALPLDDPGTFAMLSAGDTVGVFQLESAGMRDVLRQLKPDTFEDIIAVVALYRPGPMDNIPSYIRRKHGEEAPDYLYPTLKGILAETHGIMIYQEQVMQIAQELSGFSLGKADLLRRAMGKKIKAEMDQQRSAFIDGAKARGVPERKAVQIFDLVDKFAGYGFNKSHAAAYALVAYQTAYLKANYPVEFLAASMTLDIHSTEKLNTFCQELNRLRIPLLPPDINRSGVGFGVERDSADRSDAAGVGDDATGGRAIRFALAAIRNVGEAAMATLVEERQRNGPFASLDDFAARVDSRALNRRQLENLARAGAFDRLNRNRRRVFSAVEAILRTAAAAAQDRLSGQLGLFQAGAASPPGLAAARIGAGGGEDWSPMERLKEELDAIGFYLSAHPLDAYAKALRRPKVRASADLPSVTLAGPVSLAGAVVGKRERTSGKGTRYAFVQLSDSAGLFEVTVFSEVLNTCRTLLEVGQALLVRANVQIDGEQVRCIAQSVERLEDVAARVPAELAVVIDTPEPVERIRAILADNAGGEGEVKVICGLAGELQAEVVLPRRYRVGPEVVMRLQAVAGVRDLREA